MTGLPRHHEKLAPFVRAVDSSQPLFERVDTIIEQGQQFVASQTNSAHTLTYWRIGREIHHDILSDQRADYGQQIVTTLWSQLSWSHIRELLAVASAEARDFYARQAATERLSVRELIGIIDRKAYERREVANSQLAEGSAVPLDTFRDPYLLDFLGLEDGFHERDLENAIVHEMQAFLLEAGNGWAFVARQKRIIIDGDDLYLDLLFYSRPLRRLIAVELKLGKFEAAFEGQMKLYLKWLDRYERQPGEEAPIGLILCTEASRERVELLEMHKDGIVVAEYWSSLPPKKELEERLQLILRQAKEHLARRDIAAADNEEDEP